MTHRSRTVTLKQVPEKLDRRAEQNFFRELEMAMNAPKPAIILDCSHIRTMDAPTMHLLLCCLEEAMKRNGDVRLAGVSEQAMDNLRAMGIDRLFRVFDTTERAMESFQRRVGYVAPYPAASASSLASEHAA